jgi:hypothetical protein
MALPNSCLDKLGLIDLDSFVVGNLHRYY